MSYDLLSSLYIGLDNQINTVETIFMHTAVNSVLQVYNYLGFLIIFYIYLMISKRAAYIVSND